LISRQDANEPRRKKNSRAGGQTIEEGMERSLFLAKVERGIRQADEGKLIPHSEVRKRMAKWLI